MQQRGRDLLIAIKPVNIESNNLVTNLEASNVRSYTLDNTANLVTKGVA